METRITQDTKQKPLLSAGFEAFLQALDNEKLQHTFDIFVSTLISSLHDQIALDTLNLNPGVQIKAKKTVGHRISPNEMLQHFYDAIKKDELSNLTVLDNYLNSPPVNSQFANFCSLYPSTAKYLITNLDLLNKTVNEYNRERLINKYCKIEYVNAVLKIGNIKLPTDETAIKQLLANLENYINNLDEKYLGKEQNKLNFQKIVCDLATPKNTKEDKKQSIEAYLKNAENFAKNLLDDKFGHVENFDLAIKNKKFTDFLENSIKELIDKESKDIDEEMKIKIKMFMGDILKGYEICFDIEEKGFLDLVNKNINPLSNYNVKQDIKEDKNTEGEDKNTRSRSNSTITDNPMVPKRRFSLSLPIFNIGEKGSTSNINKSDMPFSFYSTTNKDKKIDAEYEVYIKHNNTIEKKDKKNIIALLQGLPAVGIIINSLYHLSLNDPNNLGVPKLMDDILKLCIKPSTQSFFSKIKETLKEANQQGVIPVAHFLYCSQKIMSASLNSKKDYTKEGRKSLFN